MTSNDYRKVSMYLANIKNGMRDSFGDIYLMYEKKVYFLCCKILKNMSEAKRMTVDIFDYVYLQAAGFRDAAVFEKWLYGVVGSRCRRYIIDNHPEMFGDYIDTDSPEGETLDDILATDADEMAYYPDGIEITVDMMQITDNILSELPLKLRVAVLQYYFSGLETEEIAAGEQISLRALKNRLLKGRNRIKTEEHKFTEMGYDAQGITTFLPDILSTMAQSIVIPEDIAASVTGKTGINCMDRMKGGAPADMRSSYSDSDDTMYINAAGAKNGGNFVTTHYAVDRGNRKEKKEMTSAVKVVMAAVAILIIIAGTVAVVLAVQGGKKDDGSVIATGDTTRATTMEITTKPTTERTTATTTEVTTETTTETTTASTTETTTQTTTQQTTVTETTTETTTQTVPVITPEPEGGNETPDEGDEDDENGYVVEGGNFHFNLG